MLIGKVQPFSNQKQNNLPTFKAANLAEVEKLTAEISKRIYGKQGAIDIYKKYPKAEGISFGTSGLPKAWLERIKDFSKFNLATFCEQLGKIFTVDRHFSNIDSIAQSLRILFNQHGIIDGNTDKLNVSYLEKGFFGRAYKIDINDENPKVIKEYKRTYRYHNNHGNYSEQNIAEYISRYSGANTNVAKYYYGDTKNGIMILDYISKDTPQPENIIELDELGLAYDDGKPRNLINNYIIDFGGMITISNLIGNEDAQNVYRIFKHLNNNEEKQELFNSIINDVNNEKYKDKLIGLTHSIKFFPENKQLDLYKKMHEFNDTDINIALIENFKNFGILWNDNEIVRDLITSEDIAIKEILAREIKHIPANLSHPLMEKLSTEDNNTIKKYLARNLNYYYKDREKRIEIYNNLTQNADLYANIALVNSLENLPLVERNKHFERFIGFDNPVITSALARNIELFQNDEKLLKKWLDKLMDESDIRIRRSLCESVKYLPENLMKETFVKLLDIPDMNGKEFLAETLTSIPGYHLNPEWFDKIIEGAGNSVKRELAKTLKTVNAPILKRKWAKELYEKGDSSVKEILKKQGLA